MLEAFKTLNLKTQPCSNPKCVLNCLGPQASQVVIVVKNLPTKAGDVRDVGSTPGREDPLEKEMATSILAWRILWTEEPDGLQSMGLKESDTTEQYI